MKKDRVTMKCPLCGFKTSREAKFCQECGAALQEESPKATSVPPPAAIELAIEESPGPGPEREMVLDQIRKGKEFLGERFESKAYGTQDLTVLKREYFQVFERVMKKSAERLKKLEESNTKNTPYL